MTHRRAPHKAAAADAWDRFVSANGPVIAASGIPNTLLASIDHFDDFLMHGRLEHHPDDSGFTIDSLSADQYASLVLFVESYFAAGYEWFTPAALRPEDQQRLGARFGRP
jgi:hypothetical protein